MITIKKKKTKIIARVLALIGVVGVIFVTFALPVFAWGNPVPDGNAREAGVYALTPLYNVIYHRYTDSGNNIESMYPANNYLNLNNRSGYTPTFPQSQGSGVYTTTVDLIDDHVGENYQVIYNGETEFDPAYYGSGVRGYLSLEVQDIFLFADEKSSSMKDGIGKDVYKYLSYIYTLPEAYDPDFTRDPNVIYECTYFYSVDGKTLVSESVYENVTMKKHEDGKNFYYLYESILENAPVKDFVDLKYIYVDYLYVNTKFTNLDLTYPVGYGGTYCSEYSGPNATVDFFSLVNEIADVESYQSMIDSLKEEKAALEQEYNYYYSETEWLRSENAELASKKDEWENKYYDTAVAMAGLREENKKLEQKNFELRNTTGAIDEYFTGISSALWNGLNEISQIGYSYVDSNGVTQTITVGSLITISVIGVVAFFVIKLFRGG